MVTPSSPTQDAASKVPPTSSTSAAPPKDSPTLTRDAPSTASTSASSSAPKHKPFPSITGGCTCSTVRYRLLTSPLFVYACHCPDCQKTTGSAFGLFLNIETYYLRILSTTSPVLITQLKRPGMLHSCYACQECKTELWSKDFLGEAVVDVKVGTLDFPGLMEPDVHSFVESKVDWLVLPEDARTVPRDFKHRELWPKASLRRLDLCLKRFAQAAMKAQGGDEEARKEGLEDGEKTPTATEFGEGEDDEAFEKRFRETERVLQERLEKLRKKLEDEGKEDGSLAELTQNLEIKDGKREKEDVPEEQTT